MMLLLALAPGQADAAKGPLAFVLMLAIVAACVVCIVKAFKFRTTQWIVCGSIAGILLFLVVTGLVVGVMRALQNMDVFDAASSSSSAGLEEATEVVQGDDMAYSLRLPVAWSTKRNHNDFDTLSSFKSLYVGVIAEEAELGTPDIIAGVARKKISEKGKDIRWNEPKPLTLDGRDWLEFSVDAKLEGIPFSYLFFVYSGHEGTYQIIGWTTQNLSERDTPKLREVMETFRFPKEEPAAVGDH